MTDPARLAKRLKGLVPTAPLDDLLDAASSAVLKSLRYPKRKGQWSEHDLLTFARQSLIDIQRRDGIRDKETNKIHTVVRHLTRNDERTLAGPERDVLAEIEREEDLKSLRRVWDRIRRKACLEKVAERSGQRA